MRPSTPASAESAPSESSVDVDNGECSVIEDSELEFSLPPPKRKETAIKGLCMDGIVRIEF